MQKFIHSDIKNLEAILTYPKETVPMMAKSLGRFYVSANKNFIQTFIVCLEILEIIVSEQHMGKRS